jgi:hypothetical protein
MGQQHGKQLPFGIESQLCDIRQHSSDPRIASALMNDVAARCKANTPRCTELVRLMLRRSADHHHSDLFSDDSDDEQAAENASFAGMFRYEGEDGTHTTRHPLAQLFTKTVELSTANMSSAALQWINLILTDTMPDLTYDPMEAGALGAHRRSMVASRSAMHLNESRSSVGRLSINANSRAASDAPHSDDDDDGSEAEACDVDEQLEVMDDAVIRLMVRFGVVTFVLHLFYLQDSVSLTKSMQTLAAVTLDRLCSCELFVIKMSENDCLLPLLARVHYTAPNSDERHALVRALHRIGGTETGAQVLSRSNIVDSLSVCIDSAERDLSCARRALSVMAAGARQQANFTLRMELVPRFVRVFQRGPQVYRDAACVLCLAANNDSSGHINTELRRYLRGNFGKGIVDSGMIDAPDLAQLANTAVQTSEEVRDFVSGRHLGFMARRLGERVGEPRVCSHWMSLMQRIADHGADLSDEFATAGAAGLLLTIIETQRQYVYSAVSVIQKMTATDTSRVALLQQRKFHALLRTISPKGNTEQMLAAFEAVSLLKAMMTPSVLSRADTFLIDAIHSLLCQALGLCPVPDPRVDKNQDPRFANTAVAVLETLLELLDSRATDKNDAATIYAQVPLDRIRHLMKQPNHRRVAELARSLMSRIASSSDRHTAELQLLDMVPFSLRADSADGGSRAVFDASATPPPGAAGKARTPEEYAYVGIVKMQRRWRYYVHLRNLSALRMDIAALFKDVFMVHSDMVEEQRIVYAKVMDHFFADVTRIEGHYAEREELMFEAQLLRDTVTVPEAYHRCTVGLVCTEALETHGRRAVAETFTRSLARVGARHRLEVQELSHRRAEDMAQQRDFEATYQRHLQLYRGLGRMMEQRRSVDRSEEHYRRRILKDYGNFVATVVNGLLLLEVERAVVIERRAIVDEAVSTLRALIVSLFPTMFAEMHRDEQRQRFVHQMRLQKLFAVGDDMLQLLDLQQLEEVRRRDAEAIATRTADLVMRRCYEACRRDLQQAEERRRCALVRVAVKQRHSEFFQLQLLPLQCAEHAAREAVHHQNRLHWAVVHEALRATFPYAWQVTEARVRCSIENQHAQVCRARVLDLRLFRLVYTEAQHRSAIALQFFHTARNLVLPLSCLRLSFLTERMLQWDIEARAAAWLDEWHEWHKLNFEWVVRTQLLQRRAIVAEHKERQEELTTYFVSSTHVLSIRLAAVEFKVHAAPPVRSRRAKWN